MKSFFCLNDIAQFVELDLKDRLVERFVGEAALVGPTLAAALFGQEPVRTVLGHRGK